MSSFEQLDPRLREAAASDAFSQSPSYPAQFATTAASLRSPLGPPPHQQFESHHSPIGNPYVPHTPQSAGNGTDGGTFEGHSDGLKRPRACEACRGLKVKCEPDSNNQDGPCKRCAKANRNCTVTVPSRKRQKKSDSRVAELEKKIDSLTQTLAQSKAGGFIPAHADILEPQGMNVHQGQHNAYQQVTNGSFSTPYATSPYINRPDVRAEDWSENRGVEYQPNKNDSPLMVMAGQKRKPSDNRASSVTTDSSGSRKNQEAPTGFLANGRKSVVHHEYADVIDRGLLTAEMATKMFECYVTKMAPHIPAVVFPAGTTAADVRKTTPTLFLAILSAASGSMCPELQRTLSKELTDVYSKRLFCEKSLELIQSIHVSAIWFPPPEHFEELKFYQLIHMSVVMAIEIGIHRAVKPKKDKAVGIWRENPWRRTPYPDPESLDARRAWLACYFLCCSASTGLRRPNLVRWTPYMGECIDALETSPEAAPTDKILCHWIRSQHITEEVSDRFAMDDPSAVVSITDSSVQRSLRGFELDFKRWDESITVETKTNNSTLMVTINFVKLYIHEVALHHDHNVDQFKPPFVEEHLRVDKDQFETLSTAHIDALSTCLDAVHSIFEAFLKFDVETIRCLPVLFFVRVAYAVVVIIKMYFVATHPNSELGKVIKKEDMKVERYLDSLVAIFRASAAENKSRPSANFLMVLLMLKTWFHRQRQGGQQLPPIAVPKPGIKSESSSETETAPSAKPRNGRQTNYSPVNTPLQLLSEVATGNSGKSHPESMANYPGGNNDWQPPTSTQNYASASTYGLNQGYGAAQGFEVPDIDYGYSFSDAIEQADMPPGLGDFGSIFNDDAFLTQLIGSGGSGYI